MNESVEMLPVGHAQEFCFVSERTGQTHTTAKWFAVH